MIFTSRFENISRIDPKVYTINSYRNYTIFNNEIARIKVISLMTFKIKTFLLPILISAKYLALPNTLLLTLVIALKLILLKYNYKTLNLIRLYILIMPD